MESIQYFVHILPIAQMEVLSRSHQSPSGVVRQIGDSSACTDPNHRQRFSRPQREKGFPDAASNSQKGIFCCILVAVCQRRFIRPGFLKAYFSQTIAGFIQCACSRKKKALVVNTFVRGFTSSALKTQESSSQLTLNA